MTAAGGTVGGTPLVIVGAGGLACEAAEVARAIGGLDVVGMVDDDPTQRGRSVVETTVPAGTLLLVERADPAVVAYVGEGAAREAIAGGTP